MLYIINTILWHMVFRNTSFQSFLSSSIQPSIHGICKTSYKVNAEEEIATDITLERDLSRCDTFVPLRDHTSPLALISGLVGENKHAMW